MAIPDYARTNFETLMRAAESGDLALLECNDAVTGEPRYVLCAIATRDGEYLITPFGHLADSNPFDAYITPLMPGGSGYQEPGTCASPA